MDKIKIQEIADEAGLSNGKLLDSAKELGFNNKRNKPRALRMCDTKDGNDQCHYNLDDMVYMSDGMYIHKDDCWW